VSEMFDSYTLWLIIAGAVATYLTRIGGYLLMTQLKSIPPRVEAGLNAVPVAVLTTLVAPTFFDGGYEVKAGMILALIVGLRFPGLTMLIAGWLLVITTRHFVG
jgi:uncharacterized membrane protein